MSIEEDVTLAVIAQRSALLAAANRCIGAERSSLAPASLNDFEAMQWAIEDAKDAEALTATLLNRAGVTWDAMAARQEVSKQALHRRLANRGERLFSEAVRNPRGHP